LTSDSGDLLYAQAGVSLKDGTEIIVTKSTKEYQYGGKGQRIELIIGGWILKPLSHSKTLVTHFMDLNFDPDQTIPTFMIKSRLRSLGTRLSQLNKILDK